MNQSSQPETSEIYAIPLDQIDISDQNVRVTHELKDLEELAASIKIHGLLQPAVLSGIIGNPPYKLISGQRRFLAHKQILKTETIRSVFAGDLTDTEALIRSLVENLQRVELEYSDTAKAVTQLYKDLGSENAVSEATGLSIRKIREHLLIEARATPKIKKFIEDRKVSIMDVKRALRAAQDDLNKAERLLELIIEHNPPSNVKRRLVTYGTKGPSATAEEIYNDAKKPHIEQQILITLSDELQAALEAATATLEMDPVEVAQKALSEWLNNQGFPVL